MAGYTRADTTNNISDGNIINANDLDNEFDSIQSAFNNSTGHSHDGTSAEGKPITKVGPVQDVIVSSISITPKTNNTIDVGSSTYKFKDAYINGTAEATTLEVSNLKALDGTSAGSIANSTGVVTLASSVLTTTDINGGTIDSATIGASTPSTGAFTTLTSSSTTTLNGTTIPSSVTLASTAATQTLTNKTISGANNTITNVSLTTGVTGTLPVANGGTNSTTAQGAINTLAGAVTSGSYLRGNGTNVVMSTIQAADVPTLNQNTTGTASNVTGTVAIANGGSGQTTAQAAMNAFAGAVTSGSYLRGNGTNVVMNTIQAADVPTLNQNTTGSAATLTTARTIAISGAVTGTATSFNGSANITIPTTVSSTQGGVVYGSSATAYGTTSAGTSGYILTSNGTSAPSWIENSLLAFPGSSFKKSVRVATTANITLSGTQTIDGIAVVAGDRVLVKDQTTASQNGIYNVSASTWTRSVDADTSDELSSAVVTVDLGTANAGELWTTTFKSTDTLGTTSMSWFEVLYNSGTWAISTTGSAATLTTARTFRTNLASTATASFNGSANVTPGVTGTLAVANGGTGATTAAQAKINLAVVTSATGSSVIPSGTTAERDGSPLTGYFRFNTTASKFEGYNGTAWGSVGGGATGGGNDAVFVENDQVVTTNYTIPATKNAMSTGPITINSGVTVTVSTGARYVVI